LVNPNKSRPLFHLISFILIDALAAMIGWILMWNFRVYLLYDQLFENFGHQLNKNFWIGLLLIPALWLVFYSLVGVYTQLYYKSRLTEFLSTLWQSLVGCLLIFFTIILDDPQDDISYFYNILLFYFIVHFSLTVIGRISLLSIIKKLIRSGRIRFNALLLGNNGLALKTYLQTKDLLRLKGNVYKGFIPTKSNATDLSKYIPQLGTLDTLKTVVIDEQISTIVIAIEKNERSQILHLLELLSQVDVRVTIQADLMDILSGSVRTNDVHDEALIEIDNNLMSPFQVNLKRLMDVSAAIFGMLLLSPLMLFIALKVKFGSEGPVIYRQKRIGKGGTPFTIYKFRSMYYPAETATPLLSSKNDPRITPWGATMRKWRLDELPQLWNIFKGDMSLVGPRPERAYFVELIKKQNPLYLHIHKVKPGLTSWGMVKFGYAENVDEMVERMKYDLMYIENVSISLDLQIIIRTFKIIISGKGK
jgi:exopolysaccharide biosynthesis polyprenyl glycosylphosphotransferase